MTAQNRLKGIFNVQGAFSERHYSKTRKSESFTFRGVIASNGRKVIGSFSDNFGDSLVHGGFDTPEVLVIKKSYSPDNYFYYFLRDCGRFFVGLYSDLGWEDDAHGVAVYGFTRADGDINPPHIPTAKAFRGRGIGQFIEKSGEKEWDGLVHYVNRLTDLKDEELDGLPDKKKGIGYRKGTFSGIQDELSKYDSWKRLLDAAEKTGSANDLGSLMQALVDELPAFFD